jgi:hypothetical protein
MQRAGRDARRKFFQAVELNPQDQTAIRIVAQIDELFEIDARAREQGLSRQHRHLLLLEKSKPLFSARLLLNSNSGWLYIRPKMLLL